MYEPITNVDHATVLDDIKQECATALSDAPHRPSDTCGEIDEAINLLQGLEKHIDTAIDTLEGAELDNPFGRVRYQSDRTIESIILILEELRKSNQALRENGTHFHNAVVETIRRCL